MKWSVYGTKPKGGKFLIFEIANLAELATPNFAMKWLCPIFPKIQESKFVI